MPDNLPQISSGHPFHNAVAAARLELAGAVAAREGGNDGRVRVAARRAVGAFIQGIAPHLPFDPGTHALANLRALAAHEELPANVRRAAERLLGGARSILAGTAYSADPIADATLVISHFLTAHTAG